jgi:hypothetical protein
VAPGRRLDKRAAPRLAALHGIGGSASAADPERVVVEALVRLFAFAGFRIAVALVVLDLVQTANRPAQVWAKSAVRAGFPLFVHRFFHSFVHK